MNHAQSGQPCRRPPRQEESHMQLTKTTVGAIAALALVPSVAVAATINGGPGNERLRGTNAPDLINGNGGNDRIFANLGNDTTYGEDGNDDLWALARGDVQGPNDTNGDTLDGGNGNDTFHTRDGEVDKITCGPGNDTALLDTVDVITDSTPQ